MPESRVVEAIQDKLDENKSLSVGISRAIRSLAQDVRAASVNTELELAKRRPPSTTGRERFVRHCLIQMCAGGRLRDVPGEWDVRYNKGQLTRAAEARPAEPGSEPIHMWDGKVRAGSTPAMTSVPGWASELTSTDLADFLLAGNNPSLAARLAELSIPVDVAGGGLKIPYRADAAASGGWVSQGGAIPVAALSLATILAEARKLAVISVYSQELKNWSTPSIESVLDVSLRRDLNAILDSSLVDAVAPTATRPGGLRYGVSTSTAGASMAADIKTLIAALGPNAEAPAFLVGPSQAAGMTFALGGTTFPFPILSSPALTGGIVIAVDLASFAMALGAPKIRVSEEAALHMDSVPTALSAVGSPNTVAVPTRSMFQTDAFAIRVILDASWIAMPGRVSWLTATSW